MVGVMNAMRLLGNVERRAIFLEAQTQLGVFGLPERDVEAADSQVLRSTHGKISGPYLNARQCPSSAVHVFGELVEIAGMKSFEQRHDGPGRTLYPTQDDGSSVAVMQPHMLGE